jgi:hypothetical protein
MARHSEEGERSRVGWYNLKNAFVSRFSFRISTICPSASIPCVSREKISPKFAVRRAEIQIRRRPDALCALGALRETECTLEQCCGARVASYILSSEGWEDNEEDGYTHSP